MNLCVVEWLRFVLFEFRPNLALHLERSPLNHSYGRVDHANSSVTLSLRTSVADKARERRTGRSQFKRVQRSPRCLCGGPPGANVPVRLGVAILGKGAAIACEPRLDSHRHITLSVTELFAWPTGFCGRSSKLLNQLRPASRTLYEIFGLVVFSR